MNRYLTENYLKLIIILIIITLKCDYTFNLLIEAVSDSASDLGEGPHWDEQRQTLLHVDTFAGYICQLNVTTGRTEKYNLKDYVSVVIPVENKKNKFIISTRNQLIELDWNDKTYRSIVSVGTEKFNDGKADAMGRLWIGTLRNNVYHNNEGSIRNAGALYRLDTRGFARMQTKSLPNGMAWSLDNRKFYCADTIERVIYVYDFDLMSGSISNKKIFFDFNNNKDFKAEELPDGMAIDKNDMLWVAVIFGARIIQLDTKTAQVIRSIPLIANQTTSIAFGGPDYKHMYVTTGNRVLSDEQKKSQPNVGKVLRLTADYIQGSGPAFRVKL